MIDASLETPTRTIHIEKYFGSAPIYQMNPETHRFQTTPYAEDWAAHLQPVIETQFTKYNKLRPLDERDKYAELEAKLDGLEESGFDWNTWEKTELEIALSRLKGSSPELIDQAPGRIHQEILAKKHALFSYIRKFPIDSLRYFTGRQAYTTGELKTARKNHADKARVIQLQAAEKFYSDEISFIKNFLQPHNPVEVPHASIADYYKRLRQRVLHTLEPETGDERTIGIHFLRALEDSIDTHNVLIPNDGTGYIIGAATMTGSRDAGHEIDPRNFATKGRPN